MAVEQALDLAVVQPCNLTSLLGRFIDFEKLTVHAGADKYLAVLT